MRASRLLSLLLLLQTRGRMSAQALAAELEVSVRTVYRDVESLSSSGVPIYADRGPAGGYQLLDGYRTRLTGLTGDEAGTLFLAGVPGPAAELGLGSVLAAAELKLRASLPGELADRADRVRDRFHLDAPGWFRADEPTPHLATVADAVWNQRMLQVRYRRWKTPREVTRTLAPLGVVLKAGRWYLVARSGERTTAYRVVNILEAEPLPEPVERPAGFDLTAFWQEWTDRYERSVYTAQATVRMTAAALDRMAYVFPPEMSRVARAEAGEPGPDGWLQTVIPIESIRHGHIELLKLGADAEILAPAELREQFTATAHGLASIYLADIPPTDLSEVSPKELTEIPPTNPPEAPLTDLSRDTPTNLPEALLTDLPEAPLTDLPGALLTDLIEAPLTDLPGALLTDLIEGSPTDL